MDYILQLLILVVLYTMLSQSLNLSAGFTGLVSLSHAGFYGIGAYTTAVLGEHHLSFWINLPVAMLVNATIAMLVSCIAIRTVEDYFVICTLGIQVIIVSVLNNWTSVTKGSLGIAGIPAISVFGLNLDNKILFLMFSTC